MAGKESRIGVVTLSPEAEQDLSEIDLYTTAKWGEAKAESYLAELVQSILSLDEEPNSGSPIESMPGLRCLTFKVRKSRSVHGHRIIYSSTDQGILVVRVLHTARAIPADI